MKLLEKLLEKSPLMLKTVKALETIAAEIQKLSNITTNLTNTVHAHHVALIELYARQGIAVKPNDSDVTDIKLPNGKKNESQKPN